MDQPPVRDDGLQLEEHREFQESFWRVERIAWIGFGCILLLAVLGMTGSSGYFARQALAFEGGLVEVPRFSRWQASDTLHVSLAAGDGDKRLALTSAFFQTFQVEDIEPPPLFTEGEGDGTVYHFKSPTPQPLALTFHVRSQRPGSVVYKVSVNGEPMRSVRTIVWP
ncbi:hypothetical protein I6F15_14145 [Bradyrhizobium sp. BRP14]|nr:hypothetical protein [Bradyrhizobium sp. BRP14]